MKFIFKTKLFLKNFFWILSNILIVGRHMRMTEKFHLLVFINNLFALLVNIITLVKLLVTLIIWKNL